MGRKEPAGNMPVLETERLVLRPLSADEANSLHRISNEPNVRLYLWDGEAISEATIKSLIDQSNRMFSEEKIGLFGVRVRGREDLLGFCGFVRLEGMEEPELWYAGADAPNTASLRVIEKLGMKYLGNNNPSAPEEPYSALYKEDFFAAMATG
jgi:RimJ/RimL family protein N-acetyltransferase